MQIDQAMGRIGRNTVPGWGARYHKMTVGGLTWQRVPSDHWLWTMLPSGQKLSVWFGQNNSSPTPSTVTVDLDDLRILLNGLDTDRIPKGTVRDAVESLVVYLTPVAQAIWKQTGAFFGTDYQPDQAALRDALSRADSGKP